MADNVGNGTMTQQEQKERDVQKAYWKEHSGEPTVEAMMLDSKAADIDKLERPEVLSLLGPLEGQRVVELGAGIGRFTKELATMATSVHAVDFMQNLIDENEATNKHYGNVTFDCADATEMSLASNSVDVVFSNWLLMYLSDEEVTNLASRMLNWLTEGGIVFFRESCFRQSGDKTRTYNPTHYRNPRDYFKIFDNIAEAAENGKVAHFELLVCKSVDTYVRVKKNQNQVCWKWRKVVTPPPGANETRIFLDNSRYTDLGIAKYQSIFGDGFVSPGGLKTTQEFAKYLDLQQDQQVLDVGCGVGGAAVFLAREYGCYVYGIDLSVNMIMTALESAAASGNGDKVSFEVSDATKREFPDNSFDAIFSRDAVLHIADKEALFKRLFKSLKPGGRLVISDYCRKDGELSPVFDEYMKARAYYLVTIDDFSKMLSEVGLEVISHEDRTDQLKSCLTEELEKIHSNEESIKDSLGDSVLNDIKTSWKNKLKRVEAGEHRWGLFVSRKPL